MAASASLPAGAGPGELRGSVQDPGSIQDLAFSCRQGGSPLVRVGRGAASAPPRETPVPRRRGVSVRCAVAGSEFALNLPEPASRAASCSVPRIVDGGHEPHLAVVMVRSKVYGR